MKYLIGIDAGTQSLRTTLFDVTGKSICSDSEPIKTTYPKPLWAEQDPNQWWHAAIKTLKTVVRKAGVPASKIAGISYDCTSCTVLAVDKNCNPLAPALLWMDERAYKEAEAVSKIASPVLKYCGGKISPQWMVPKALWLKKNNPQLFNKAYRIFEQTDFFTHRLTGRWTASLDNVTSKWNYAKPLGGWTDEFLKQAGLSEIKNKWPEKILPVGTYIGNLKKEVADEVGLSPDVKVAQGGIDAHAGMIALSAVNAGDIAFIVGTSTCHMAMSKKPVFADIWGPFPDALKEGTYVLEGGQTATGSIVNWLIDNFAVLEKKEAQKSGRDFYSIMDKKAQGIPPGSEGLVLLDYFQGNRMPYKDPLARGTILGLTLKHGFSHILRAIYEGTAYGTRLIIDNMEKYGFKINKIYAGGGGTKSSLWMQIHADVCGRPIYIPKEKESMGIGSAIWAGLGSGIFKDYNDAIKNMVHITTAIKPNMKNHKVYNFYYKKYKQAYKCLKNEMHDIAKYLEE